VTTPVLRSWKELGIDLKEAPPGTRSSLGGQVPARVTYGEWLKGQPHHFQAQVLGRGRAELFRRGVVPASKFTDARLRPLTLRQLEALETTLAEAPSRLVTQAGTDVLEKLKGEEFGLPNWWRVELRESAGGRRYKVFVAPDGRRLSSLKKALAAHEADPRPVVPGAVFDLPAGWQVEHRIATAGREYKVFVAPDGKRLSSLKKAREHAGVTAPPKKPPAPRPPPPAGKPKPDKPGAGPPTTYDRGSAVRERMLDLERKGLKRQRQLEKRMRELDREIDDAYDAAIDDRPDLLAFLRDRLEVWEPTPMPGQAVAPEWAAIRRARKKATRPLYAEQDKVALELSKLRAEGRYRELLYLEPEDQSTWVMNPRPGTSGKVRKAAEGGAEFWGRVAHKRAVGDKTHYVAFEAEPSNRSWQKSGTIGISEWRGNVAHAVHELGHVVEHRSSSWLHRAKEFLHARAAGDKLRPLSELTEHNYGALELAWEDEFINPYMGKSYHGFATEITSMGVELLYSDPIKLAKKDPEMFDMLVDWLRGL
jgi:hypothetical protein